MRVCSLQSLSWIVSLMLITLVLPTRANAESAFARLLAACSNGDDEACLRAQAYTSARNSVDQNARRKGAGVSLCELYPTRCAPYLSGRNGFPGVSHTYTPGQLAPGLGIVARSGLDGLPPAVRNELFPRSAADAVRLGDVDDAIDSTMRQSVDPLLDDINGYGRGGAGYTNEAAKAVLDGSMSPATAACRAMGMGNC
jgi:hypothetical protein